MRRRLGHVERLEQRAPRLTLQTPIGQGLGHASHHRRFAAG